MPELRIGLGVDAHAFEDGVAARPRRRRDRPPARARRPLRRRRDRPRAHRCAARRGGPRRHRLALPLRTTSVGGAPTRSTCCAMPTRRSATPGFELVNADCILIGEEPRIATAPGGDAAAARRRARRRAGACQRPRDDDRPARLHGPRRGSRRPGRRAAGARMKLVLATPSGPSCSSAATSSASDLGRVHAPRRRRERLLGPAVRGVPGPPALARRRRRPADRRVERACRSRSDPDELPDDGWDAALRAGVRAAGPRRRVSAIAISVGVDHRGPGPQQDDARRDARRLSRRAASSDLVAPVRPSLKHRYPLDADRALRRMATRGRQAARPVAARARATPARELVARRAASRCGSQARSRSGRSWTELRFPDERHLRRPGRARAGRDRPRARRGRLRRAERLDAPHASRRAARTSSASTARRARPGGASRRASRSSVSQWPRLGGDEPQQHALAAGGTSPRTGTACGAARTGVRATGSRRRAGRPRSAAHARDRRSRRGRRAPAARPARTRARCAPGSARRWCRRAAPARRRPELRIAAAV